MSVTRNTLHGDSYPFTVVFVASVSTYSILSVPCDSRASSQSEKRLAGGSHYILSISRRRSFSLIDWRLSYSFLPLARAMSSFAYPPSEMYSFTATIVRPFSLTALWSLRSSRFVRRSLRSRRGSWRPQVPHQ